MRACLPEVLAGADIFLGLSAPRVLKQEWLELFAPNPLILALANPEPEILPELVRQSRPDAIIATGRSDLPNQVNNVLCFPFIFRGALDVRATAITESMKLAAVEAIAELARVEALRHRGRRLWRPGAEFGPDYIIPKPFDPRLILHIAPAVARAAMDAGVARKPIEDFDVYKHELERFVFRSGQLLRPVIEVARKACPRIVYAEGEDERTLRAVQSVVDDEHGAPDPGRARHGRSPAKIAALGLRMKPGQDVRIVDFEQDKVLFAQLLEAYQQRVGRRGTPPDAAVRQLRQAPDRIGRHVAGRRRGGCGDLRRNRRLVAAFPVRAADHSAPRRGEPGLRADRVDPAGRRAVLLRHACECGPDAPKKSPR